MAILYKDRRDAGAVLAKSLKSFVGLDAVLICIPRGGAVVCAEVSKGLGISMDAITPRKIPAPSNPELAVGAVVFDGTAWLDEQLMADLGVPEDYISGQKKLQAAESMRRYSLFRHGAPDPILGSKTVILVDDGIATGATMLAAAMWVLKKKPKKVIVAVPVASKHAETRLSALGVDIVCPKTIDDFVAVGEFYMNFDQVPDEEVLELMDKYAKLN